MTAHLRRLAGFLAASSMVACGGGGGGVETPPAMTRAVQIAKAGNGGGTVTSSVGGISCGAACTATVGLGTAVTFTATSDATSTFAGWAGGGCSGTGTCTTTVDADTTVTATFTRNSYDLTVAKAGTGAGTVTSAAAGIDCGATCTASILGTTTVTLTATPDATSTLAGWSGGGCTGAGTCTTTVTGATTVTATFTRNSYLLSVSKAGTGAGTVTSDVGSIDCGSSCSASIPGTTAVTLTATPDATSTFAGWSGGCNGTGACTTTITSATSVTATFTRNSYVLTVARTGNGAGTVTSGLPGIDCGSTCAASIAGTTSVTLTATADATSTFGGWSGAGCSGAGTCTVTITSATSVTATFTRNSYALTVSKTGNGTGTVTSAPAGIDCGATCSGSYLAGTTVTLSATPDATSSFTGWSGAACAGTGTCSVTVEAAASVTATFAQITFGLDVALAGDGVGSVSSEPAGISCPGGGCSATYLTGTAVTLSALPIAGTFTGWDGAGCSGTGTCTVTMDGAKSVTATFGANRTLDVVVLGSGQVDASVGGNVCYGGTCGPWSYAQGTEVVLAATPSGGYRFTGWSGGCTGTGTCTVTLGADTTVTASFTAERALDVSVYGSGTVTSSPAGISCGADCAETWLDGDVVTLTATPAAGWEVSSWGDPCAASGTATTCTLTLGSGISLAVFFAGPFEFAVTTPYAIGYPFSMIAGESRVVPVTVSKTRGGGLPVTLSVAGLPAGAVATFDSTPTPTPTATATMTIVTSPGTAPGTYELSVEGTDGAFVGTMPLTLVVRPASGLSDTPYGVVVEPGGATALVSEGITEWGVGRLVRVDLASRLVTKTVAQGATPADLAVPSDVVLEGGGATALVADFDGLVRVTLATGATQRIPLSAAVYRARGLVLEGGGVTALLTDCVDAACQNGRLSRVTLADGSASRITPALSGIVDPRGIAVEASGSTVLLAERGGAPGLGRLLRVDLSSGTAATLASGLAYPTGVVLEPGGGTALVSCDQGTVVRIELALGTKTTAMQVNAVSTAALALEGATALVVEQVPNRLVRLHLESGGLPTMPIAHFAPSVDSFEVLKEPRSVVLEDAATALVADCGTGQYCSDSGRLVRVDLATGQVGSTVVSALNEPRGLALEPGGATALVVEVADSANAAGRVDRVDLSTGTITGLFPVSATYPGLWGVAVDAGFAYVTSDYAILKIDLSAATVTRLGSTLPASCHGRGIAVEPGGTHAVFVQACYPGYGEVDELVRIDLSTGATTSLAAGYGPMNGVTLEPGGAAVLVTEGMDGWSAGRLVKVELATGLVHEVAAPIMGPHSVAVQGDGALVVASQYGLFRAAATAAYEPALVSRGLDRPTGLALDPDAALTAFVTACSGTSDCTGGSGSPGRLDRVDLSTGARTTVVASLNQPRGVAWETSSQVLVLDCGQLPLDCASKGRLLRISGAVVSSILSTGLNEPTDVALEAGGATALVTDRGSGRLLRVNLAAKTFSVLATALQGPVQVVPEAGGATALVAAENLGLFRVDLATQEVKLVARYELGRFAVEAGGETALLLGTSYPAPHHSLARVNLATGGLDVLATGLVDDVQAAALAPSGLWYLQTPESNPQYRGALVRLSNVPAP